MFRSSLDHDDKRVRGKQKCAVMRGASNDAARITAVGSEMKRQLPALLAPSL